jgi:hypothetical protein
MINLIVDNVAFKYIIKELTDEQKTNIGNLEYYVMLP